MTHDELRKLATRARDARMHQNWREAADEFRAAARPEAVLELLDRIAELEGAEKRGYDAAEEQAHREAVRQGDVYRNNAKGASGLSASTLDEYRFAAAACDYVASAIAAMVRP